MSALPELEPAPDYAEALKAWRVWRVVDRDGLVRLGSVVKATIWPVGEALAAECLHVPGWLPWRRSHGAPEERCRCGIYATALERLGDYLLDAPPRDAVGWAIGRVALWGTVVECERGFRASRAYPIELFVPSDPAGRLRRGQLSDLRSDYGVPVSPLAAPARDVPTLLA